MDQFFDLADAGDKPAAWAWLEQQVAKSPEQLMDEFADAVQEQAENPDFQPLGDDLELDPWDFELPPTP